MSIRKKGKTISKERKISKIKIPKFDILTRTRLKSVEKAKTDAKAMEKEFNRAKTREERMFIRRKVILAANRSEKRLKDIKRKRLPEYNDKKLEYKEIAKIYRKLERKLLVEEIWQEIERPAIPD